MCGRFSILLLLCIGVFVVSGESENKVKVCVIGAGAAGLSTAKHLAEHGDRFDVKVYEKSSEVGGTWVYTEKTGNDEHGYPIHSSMYKNLRCVCLFTLRAFEILGNPDSRN